MTALIAAHDLSFGRGDALVSGLTFEIQPGQTWFVLGKNGSGKSTLMHTLLLEIAPGAGQVTAAPDIVDRSRLGVVAQTDPGPCRLPTTVFEFVTFGLAGLTLETAVARTRTRAALAAMGIEHLAPRGIDALSGGERQRARVARALARQPRLLLLDEPTAALDLPSTAALVERLLALQQREGIALFWISHDLELVRRHASHLLALDGTTATVHEVQGSRDSGSLRALLAHAAGMVGTHTVMHDCR